MLSGVGISSVTEKSLEGLLTEVGLTCRAMKPPATDKAWYESWFDSPHYHRLYGHRSNREAQNFIERLHAHFEWKDLSLLDLACGKGRHARAAAELGHQVVGVDLSPNSIDQARLNAVGIPGLNFVQADMRTFELHNKFDGILNLFTSFGYFNKVEDHYAVLESMAAHLQPGGFLLLDFLDAAFSRKHLVPSDELTRDGVTYRLAREIRKGSHGDWDTFVKTIQFEEGGTRIVHTEEVAALSNADLTLMLENAGFQILERFGTYRLDPWVEGACPRLIIHAIKS